MLAAQSQLEFTLQQFNNDEVKGYVQPFGDLFGANMNSGLYHSARISKTFHLRIDLIVTASIVKDNQKSYNTRLPEGFVPKDGSYSTATAFGGKGTTFVDANSGLEYKSTDGIFSMNYLPLFIPQLTVGALFGTEASVRYISTPPLGGGKFPSMTLFGVGARHSVSRYFLEFPLDVAIGGYYSRLSVGDLIDYAGASVNFQVSKCFSLITVYGGAAWETSRTKIHYFSNAASRVLLNFSIEGDNHYRVTTGLELDLQAIRIFADANFGYVQHFSGGIGFGF